MRAINVLLAIGVSVLLAFLVFEGGLRLIPAFRPKESINQFDAKLGWAKKPNARVDRKTAEFDVTFETNALGLRDDETTDKPADTFRVLLLGDSFTLGYTVDREDLFADQLEGWWQAEGRQVEVVNAGTEGYSTDQQVLWYLEHGVDFDADLVLLFPYENDLYWNGQDSYNRFPKPRFAADGSLETGTLADPGPEPGGAIKQWATGNFLLFLASSLAGGKGAGPHAFQPDGSDAFLAKEFAPLMKEEPGFLADCIARTRGAMTALRDRCVEEGAELLVVPIPSESVVHVDQREKFRSQKDGLQGLDDDLWDPNKPVETFLGLATELGIATLDPRDSLKTAGAEEPLYFDQEWHFNPRGNAVFAGFLHDELDRLGLLSAQPAKSEATLAATTSSEGGLPTWMFVFAGLWLVLGSAFCMTYKDENPALSFLKVGGLLALIFTIVLGGSALLSLNPALGPWIAGGFVLVVLGFVAFKLGRRLGTIAELLRAFTLRGHWYLMPLVVVLLTIGSLLVVAASSPLVAPFIYTLF